MDLGPVLEARHLRAVPICHYQMEYAAWVRHEIERYQPQAIAVELPSTLKEPVMTAIRRLPFLSVVLYQDGAGNAVYLPIEPCDAICEAVRSGLERALPVHLVDLDVDEYPLHPEPMPDPYAVTKLGLPAIWRAYRQHGPKPGASGPLDARREHHMAYWLKTLTAQHERVLFVCGMAHLSGVMAQLDRSDIRPAARMHREGVRVFNLHAESAREVTGELPFVTAVYERWRSGASPAPFPPSEEEELDSETLEPKLRVVKKSVAGPSSGTGRSPGESEVEGGEARAGGGTTGPDIEKGLMELLRRIFQDAGGAARGLRRRTRPEGAEEAPAEAPQPFSLRVLEGKRQSKHPPAPAPPGPVSFDAYDRLLPAPGSGPVALDRQKILLGLLRAARAAYRKSTGDKVQPWQTRNLTRFLRRYATTEDRLLPDFYQTLVGARGCVDDNYAYEVWMLGSGYPFLDGSGKLETIRVQGEEIWMGMRRLRFRRRVPDRSRRRPTPLKMRRRPRERRPGEWAERFEYGGICSYPPEDVVVEDFGTFLKKKARKILSEERSRVEPFSTSLLDGIDMRETIRNWSQGQRLFVRENGRISGEVGAVVLVFDEDRQGDRFPWSVTWWGEHEQESDLAFYATRATAQVVGPGIARCQYGGFLMTHPPGRLFDVWADPLYDSAETKAERLLLAAIDYSLEKHVAYVAAKPPRSRIVAQARRMDKKVVYVPLGVLSPVTLKKIRVFHVLSDHAVRAVARDYIY